MRFISGGPVIPDFLLGERDAGRVVFLCGAGVSIPSGMPTFPALTKFVIERLAPERDSEIIKAFAPWVDSKLEVPLTARTPLDQIFNLLQLEYGRDQVGRLVSERLTVSDPKKACTTKHEIISRISANQDGSPQIVTTNFDHLFELALGSDPVRTYVPPTFPDLRHDVPVTGITYLHGRLSEASAEVHDYILGSADFGRAYLAQGWATSFIRQLLQNYTVVLLGYQAEDPPVKYLLQGLSGSQDHNKERLFAFDQGQANTIEAKWQDRGVTPIAYPESPKHQALWDTLEAWATRSDNPVAWKSSIIDIAGQSPRTLKPHERGIVVHMVRTAAGAKQFAEAEPAAPIEWLSVLDRTCRFAMPYKSFDGDAEAFDPLEAYGLDDDPPRPPEGRQEAPYESEDLITWRRGDDSLDHTQRLAGGMKPGLEPMSSRLLHLSGWMLRHVDQPALTWWVARQYRLHPRLREMLKRTIEDSDRLTEDARKLWMIILEALEDRDHGSLDMEWFQVLRRIKVSGWTSSVIRTLEAATEPKFKITPPYGISSTQPPIGDWSKVKWREIANIDLHFPSKYGKQVEVPEEALPTVFTALQRNLIRASERLNEADRLLLRLATFYPEKADNSNRHVMKQDTYVSWFRTLLDRMAISRPKLLRAHIDTWPDIERFIFDKLRLYVCNNSKLFSGDEVSELLLALNDEQFWRSDYKRELLFLLSGRWSDFTSKKKECICNRILNGDPKYDGEEYGARRTTHSVIIFGWLVRDGCKISTPCKVKWLKLKSKIPEWQDTWIDGATSTNELKTGWIRTDDDASVFDGVPVNQILAVAKENTRSPISEFTDYKPFLGLVKNKPAKALAALFSAAKRGEYPSAFWNTVISNWPNTAPATATRMLHKWMRQLPPEAVFEARWTLGDWLRDRFPKFAETDEALAFSVYDILISKLLAIGSKATQSGIGETRTGGDIINRSRRTLEHAINGPIGQATEGLMKALDGKKLQQGEGLPDNFKTRVERLLAAPGEGSDHAICLLARNASWLNDIDPGWVSSRMVPLFNPEHHLSEPAWNGILFNSWKSVQSVFDQIKGSFLALLNAMRSWAWRDHSEENAYLWIVQASLLASDNGPRLTFDEVRDCLRQIEHDGLLHVIWFLGQVGAESEKGWERKVILFIQSAWPRERRIQTEKTSKAWASMLEDTEEAFPSVLSAVRGFLHPIHESHHGLYGFHRDIDDKKSLTVRFPNDTLDLLNLIVPNDPRCAPYDLSQVLNLLLETDPNIAMDRRYKRLSELDASR